MAWTGLTLTNEGRKALNQAQLANKMNFKSIVVGDGMPPANFSSQKKLVHQLYELDDLKIDATESGCKLTADFPEVDYDYYYREIGVMVSTEDGDKLYVYDNCGDDAQYIVSSTGVEKIKKRLRLSLTIAGVSEITVSSPSILYVAYDEFEKKVGELEDQINSSNKDLDGKLDTDGDASDLTTTIAEASSRTNLTSGEKLSESLGKVEKYFSDLKDVAFTGSYKDLTDTPEAQEKQVFYCTCTTAASTAAKVATTGDGTDFKLSDGTMVIVAVKFTYAVPASATLNINGQGAKPIYYKGAAITANVINAGDTATFIYSGGYYYVISVDSSTSTCYYAERAAPEDTSILWIDTSAGNVLKFYNTSTNTWEPVNMVWS